MIRRILPVLIVATVATLMLSCPAKTTGIRGQVILQTGQTGDVRNCRVQLFVKGDLTESPVKEVASTATGVDQTKADFEFTEVVPGYYYILAWKDLNGNGAIDNNDIVGVHGGFYRVGYGGTGLTVIDGKMTEAGDITMLIYKQLLLSLSFSRDANNWLNVGYGFNDNCNVASWRITVPGGAQGDDPTQAGAKLGGTTYWSNGWNVGGNPPPSGTYGIDITGTWAGAAFAIHGDVNVVK